MTRETGNDTIDLKITMNMRECAMEAKMLRHTIDPVYDSQSRVLILGSFPSVKSREERFFYGHKQNRFWRVMAQVLGCEVPGDVARKR